LLYLFGLSVDENNKAVLSGAFEEDFEQFIGKTPYLGLHAEDDTVWKAKGEIIPLSTCPAV